MSVLHPWERYQWSSKYQLGRSWAHDCDWAEDPIKDPFVQLRVAVQFYGFWWHTWVNYGGPVARREMDKARTAMFAASDNCYPEDDDEAD